MEKTSKPPSKHLGRKIRQMRELLGVRQEAVAEKIGVSQQAISKMEQSEKVDDAMLERIAKALGVNPEAIKNLDEEATVYNIIQNNYEGSKNEVAPNFVKGNNNHFTFNPVDKWLEAIEENKRLYEELLKSEREKVEMLQKLLDGKK